MIALVMSIPEHNGGAERRLARIFNAIAKSRKDIDFVVRSTQKKIDKFYKENFKEVYFSNTIIKDESFLGMFQVSTYLAANQYKLIIYFDGSKFSCILNTFAFVYRMQVLTIIADYFMAMNHYTGIKKCLCDYTVKTSSYIDCLYPSSLENLKERFPKLKISITPNSFTDLEKYKSKPKEKTMVFAAARLNQSKNPHLLIDAVNLIQDHIRGQKYKIYLCGGGYDKDYLIEKSIQNGTEDIIIFTGNVDLGEYMPQAEAFFSLQIEENYPSQSLLEGISCGCYIFATDVGDTRKIVLDSFGTCVKNDQEELAQAILRYLKKTDDEKARITQCAREFAENHFTIETCVDYFINILDGLLNK